MYWNHPPSPHLYEHGYHKFYLIFLKLVPDVTEGTRHVKHCKYTFHPLLPSVNMYGEYVEGVDRKYNTQLQVGTYFICIYEQVSFRLGRFRKKLFPLLFLYQVKYGKGKYFKAGRVEDTKLKIVVHSTKLKKT